MGTKNLQVLLASRPQGEPTAENFEIREADVPQPRSGQMLLRAVYLSLDPYMRGRMNAGKSYVAPIEVGAVLEGRAVAVVVSSELDDFRPGDVVFNLEHGWQVFALSDGTGVQKIDPAVGPVSYALGVLGMPGLTAYTGLENIGRPQAGETLVVAAASGAVGSVVGQIGRIKECRVVGIAGGRRQVPLRERRTGFRRVPRPTRARAGRAIAGRLSAGDRCLF